MDERQASALTAHLVVLTGLFLFIAGQSPVPHGTIDAWPPLVLESPSACRLAAHASERYFETLTRTLVEGETATLVPFDAPDCEE